MTEYQEIIAKYRLDLDDLKAQVRTLQGEFNKVDDASAQSASSASKNYNALGQTLKGVGAGLVAFFAVDRLGAFAKRSVEAFGQAEQAARKLSAAVTAQGGLAGDVKALEQAAADLEARTFFDGDDVKNMQTIAVQFGLTADAVRELTPVVADFAAATGQDLDAALQTVLQGVNGMEKGLKIYGVTLDGTSTRNERLATITEQLTKKFNGQAEALASTLQGGAQRAGVALENLEEQIGEAMAPAIQAVSDGLRAFFDLFQDSPTEVLVEERRALEAATTNVLSLKVGTEQRTEAVRQLQQLYPAYLGNLDAETASNEELKTALQGVNNELTFKIAQEKAAERLQPLREDEAEAANAAAAARRRLSDELAQLLKRSREYNATANEENLTLLESLPLELQASELLAGKVKLYGISTASLGNLGQALEIYNKAQANFSGASLASADAQAEVNQELEIARGLLLGNAAQAKKVTRTGLEGETEDEKKAREEREKKAKEAEDKRLENLAKNQAEQVKIEKEGEELRFKISEENLDRYLALQALKIARSGQSEEERTRQLAALELDGLNRRLALYQSYGRDVGAILGQIAAKENEAQNELTDRLLQAGERDLAAYVQGRQALIRAGSRGQAEAERELSALQVDELSRRLELYKKYGQDVTELSAQLAQAQLAYQELVTDQTRELWAGLEQQTSALLGNLLGLLDEQAQADRERLEARQQELAESYQAEEDALRESLERRALGQREYEDQLAALRSERATEEAKVAAQIAAINKRQDAYRKAQAVFQIGVDTPVAAINVLKTVPPPFGFVLQGLIIANGLLQLARVLSQPLPQYYHGTEYVSTDTRRDLGRVPLGRNKPGRDTVPALLHEGERVVTASRNRKYWAAYQALDQDRLADFVWKNYTAPALERERSRSREAVATLTQVLTGAPVSTTTAPGGELPVGDELRRLWRRGLSINNLDELARLITTAQPSPYRH